MAVLIGVLLNILINAIPILVILLPFIFIRQEIARKIYRRIFWGITIFFLVYYILPVIFQWGAPDTLNHGSENIAIGIGYLFSRTGSLIINYFQLPLINFGFIFIIAPFISILFLLSQLRKEKGKIGKKLLGVTFEVKKSPKEMIIERFKKNDWTEEKQLFKLLIVLLPISMYLLTTILKIAGLEIANISDDKTALGWFIEVFFAYLATFLFGIHLLKSSNAAYQGKFLGEKLENQVSSSLISVGTPISILSIILFLVEYFESFPLILYFFGFFIMAAFIFISYLAVFEPICILILIKIINAFKKKTRDEEIAIETKSKVNSKVILYPMLFGILAFFVLIIIGTISQSLASGIAQGNIQLYIGQTAFSFTQSLDSALIIEEIQIILNFGLIAIILVISLLLYAVLRATKKLGLSTTLFVIIFLVFSFLFGAYIVLFGQNIQWITGKLVVTDVFGGSIPILTLRTAFLNANFESKVLYYLAIPYQYTRYLFAFSFIGITIYYINQRFFTKTIREEKYVVEVTYSVLNSLPDFEECEKYNYLIISNENAVINETEREEIKEIYQSALKGIYYHDLAPYSDAENKRIYTTLKYMWKKRWIDFWVPEFGFIFEKAELSALYIMYSDGRDVFSYQFKEENVADPALVAGMFSAITSFIRETTRSSDYLRSIDHGDQKILIEYGNYVFGALFASMETSEIRSKLKTFITKFEEIHGNVLKDWSGITSPFEHDDELVHEIFEL
ncbi:MAG: hypothetical protein ACTSRZ_20960 [Promethearchaeota archaeon]